MHRKKKRLLGLICIRDDYRKKKMSEIEEGKRKKEDEEEEEKGRKTCFTSLENWLKFKRMKLR